MESSKTPLCDTHCNVPLCNFDYIENTFAAIVHLQWRKANYTPAETNLKTVYDDWQPYNKYVAPLVQSLIDSILCVLF